MAARARAALREDWLHVGGEAHAATRAHAAPVAASRSDSARVAALAAVAQIVADVDAAGATVLLLAGANARAGEARRPGAARPAALPAVYLVRLQIDAGQRALCQRPAVAGTNAVQAHVTLRACVIASAAMLRVGAGIGTAFAARHGARSADAHAANATRCGWTGVAARSAVGGIHLRIDAGSAAGYQAAAAITCAAHAAHSFRASIATAAAVIAIDRQIDAGLSAALLTPGGAQRFDPSTHARELPVAEPSSARHGIAARRWPVGELSVEQRLLGRPRLDARRTVANGGDVHELGRNVGRQIEAAARLRATMATRRHAATLEDCGLNGSQIRRAPRLLRRTSGRQGSGDAEHGEYGYPTKHIGSE
jgi:hypothetical protein